MVARSRRRRRRRPPRRAARSAGPRPGTRRAPARPRRGRRPRARSAASAAAAFRRLCSPATRELAASTGASSSPRTTCGTSASQRVEHRLHLGQRGEGRVVVEVDVRDHGDLRPQQLDRCGRTRRPRRRASPRPRRAFAAELRDLAADQPGRDRAPAGRGTNAIIAAVVVLPCAPATTIEGRSETSSASSSRARAVPATRA